MVTNEFWEKHTGQADYVARTNHRAKLAARVEEALAKNQESEAKLAAIRASAEKNQKNAQRRVEAKRTDLKGLNSFEALRKIQG